MTTHVLRAIACGCALTLAACSPVGDKAQSLPDQLQSQDVTQSTSDVLLDDEQMSNSTLPEQAMDLCYAQTDICAGGYLSAVRPEVVLMLKADHPGVAALEAKVLALGKNMRVRHVRFSDDELQAAKNRLFEAAGDRATFGGVDIYGNGITVGIKDVEPGGGILHEMQLPEKARQVYEELVDAGYSVRIEPGDEGYNLLEFEPEDPSGQSN